MTKNTIKKYKDQDFDYKNIDFLKNFTSEIGKIIPSRISNLPLKQQRKLQSAIKKARVMALLPFVIK